MPAKATLETTGNPPSPATAGEGNSDGNAPLNPSPQPRKKRKGLKPRHIPQRTCIVTRQTGDKRGLIRIVRTPEGRVEVDATGKKNGRGAYLTADRAIWERALKGNLLGPRAESSDQSGRRGDASSVRRNAAEATDED